MFKQQTYLPYTDDCRDIGLDMPPTNKRPRPDRHVNALNKYNMMETAVIFYHFNTSMTEMFTLSK
jgi:hypothetical protein